MPDPRNTPSPPGSQSLGSMLGPALREECGGRLSTIEWFRSTWQRGGAATGLAGWRLDDGRQIDCVVKLPVGPAEHRWTTQLGSPDGDPSGPSDAPTPRVLASGVTVGGYDLGWLVLERLDGQSLTSGWSRRALEDLIEAAASMHARAAGLEPPGGAPAPPDWLDLCAKSREMCKAGALPEAQRWNAVLKRAHKALPGLSAHWAARPIDTWCHGDLHPGNAMRRRSRDEDSDGCCVLIDLALVHPGHWVEDAVYLERQFWGRPELLHGLHVVSHLAKCRREKGLRTEGDYGMLANIRRCLMAVCVPVFVEREGHPKYTHAALDLLERLLPQVGRL